MKITSPLVDLAIQTVADPTENIGKTNTDKKAISEKANKVAEEFEAIFLDLMLKSMRQTTKPENESNAQAIYTSMLDSEYAKTMANTRSYGIKELILDYIQKNQHEIGFDKQAALQKYRSQN